MATVYWDSVLPLITPHVPSCPEATIKEYLAFTVNDFCAKTHIWREDLDIEYTVANVAEYSVEGSATIESVLSVVCNGIPLEHTDSRLVDPSTLSDKANPTAFWVVNDTSIRLYKIPDKKYSLKISVALKPSRTATGVEDWIYATWADAIVSGAISRLSIIPNKDWTSPEMYEFHKDVYEQAITNSRIRDLRNVSLKVRYRRM